MRSGLQDLDMLGFCRVESAVFVLPVTRAGGLEFRIGISDGLDTDGDLRESTLESFDWE